MLSSRYLHLHEALGLGPMWLKQSAKVLPAQTAAAPSAPAAAETAAPAAKPVAARTSADARLSAIAAVNTARSDSDGIGAAAERPSEKSLPASADTEPPAPAVLPVITANIQAVRVMVVSICPAPEDSAAGRLFSGDAGVLLDNMLAAINLKPTDAHKTAWVKTATVFTPTPSAEEIAAALPQLQAELAAAQARSVLFLGQIFEQHQYNGIIRELCGNLPHFVIPHPARLLRQPQLKRNAWTELKKLKQILSV